MKKSDIQKTRSLLYDEIHDSIGTVLTEIHMLSQTTAVLSQNAENLHLVQKNCALLSEMSHLAVEELENIFSLFLKEDGLFKDLISSLKKNYEHILKARDITVVFHNDASLESDVLSGEKFRQLYLLLHEVTNNSIKHSQCSKIDYFFRKKSGSLEISIKDDGCGFDLKTAVSGKGMKTMSLRAKKLNLDLRIKSKKGLGTHIILTPKNKNLS